MVINYRCEINMSRSYIFKGLSQLSYELVGQAWTRASHIMSHRHSDEAL